MQISELESVQREIRGIEDRFLLIKNRQEQTISDIDKLKRERDELFSAQEKCAKAIDFIERVAVDERKTVKAKVEELITSCLHEVFDDTYSIEFDYGVKRNRTSVEIFSVRYCPDGLVVKRTIDGIGGGLADAISLPLKLVVLLNDVELERVFIVDEPGKHLSAEHVPKFAKFLSTIAKRLNVQIIMSSHHTSMDDYANSVNLIKLDGSVSQVERKL